MALRSIDQRYWTDPYVESLSATEKLVYIHLFSSAHTNLVGVFQASRRMIAFQTACPGPDVDAALERFRRDGKAIVDGGEVWLASYIRHQCTSSPKMVAAMRGQLAKVESDAIRIAIIERYPHIMEAPGPRPPVQRCLLDTVSVLSRYKREEKEKISAGAAPVEGAPAKAPESSPAPLVVSDEVARILQRDFPEVDYGKQIARARNWCVLRGQAIRNVLLFLRKWFANAAKPPKNDRPQTSTPKPALPAQRPCPPDTAFKVPTEAELEENRLRGLAVMAKYWGKQQAALA
ncbi:hypothetical protein [Bilophila sp. 4_1_30]|uniref:hypothetical protein n=1 Tax=Bilophila sp. 4_1_30 TaxID=693988 RepID=UPI000223812B|nr:hypothetical protein [Bilophila sp. 4_1_30]EGW45830.1 hypothetical protein HMPREF0178_00061 [Bilophila sp. 4_1_30]